MSEEPRFAVARSSRPSPLKSPATIAAGADPAAVPVGARDDAGGCRGIDGGLERTVAVAHEHRNIVGVQVSDGQVDMAVAEITGHDRHGVHADWERFAGLERAVPAPVKI